MDLNSDVYSVTASYIMLVAPHHVKRYIYRIAQLLILKSDNIYIYIYIYILNKVPIIYSIVRNVNFIRYIII